MGKIVIKTTRKSNVSKVKVRGFKRLDAAKMALYAFIGITGGLTQEDREHILQVADILIQDATDEINVECAIAMDAARQILDKLSKDVSK